MDGFKKRLSESIQFRLSASLSLAILIVALVAGTFAFISAFDEAHEMQDDTLRQVALLLDQQQMTFMYPKRVSADDGDEDSRVIVQYLADGSKASGADDSVTPLPFPTSLADGLSTVTVLGEEFRVLVHTTARGDRIAVAQENDIRDKDARENALRSVLPFLILLPVLLLVVDDLVRKLFRPIAELSGEIHQRAEQDLHPIDERHLPSEVRPFVVEINQLLMRVALSMETQRRFVADAAHELRSPMTALSLQAERLGATELSGLALERLIPLRQGIERGRKLIDQLLNFASAQSLTSLPTSMVSVHDVYRRVLEDLLPLAEDKHIDIGVEGIQDAHVLINEMDLITLVKNLVENAIRYTPPDGKIDLIVGIEGDTALLQVKDSGPGISVEEQERVFDPFYRCLGSHEVGSGLGLSIVKAIAGRNGGRVRLELTDKLGRTGLCASVRLPVVQISPNQFHS